MSDSLFTIYNYTSLCYSKTTFLANHMATNEKKKQNLYHVSQLQHEKLNLFN